MARSPKSKTTRPAGKTASTPLDWFHDAASFEALSDEQKEQVSTFLDREDLDKYFRPLTNAQRRRWDRIRRKPGRPKIGNGTKVVSVTVETDLLSRADAYAKAAGLTRARLVGLALESFIKGDDRIKPGPGSPDGPLPQAG